MSEQLQIEGIKPVRAKVPDARLAELSRMLGGLVALGDVVDELKKMQAEHAKVPGLTLAVAVAEKHLAQAQLKNSRMVLILASAAGLEVERMVTSVELRGDGGIDIVSIAPSDDEE